MNECLADGEDMSKAQVIIEEVSESELKMLQDQANPEEKENDGEVKDKETSEDEK